MSSSSAAAQRLPRRQAAQLSQPALLSRVTPGSSTQPRKLPPLPPKMGSGPRPEHAGRDQEHHRLGMQLHASPPTSSKRRVITLGSCASTGTWRVGGGGGPAAAAPIRAGAPAAPASSNASVFDSRRRLLHEAERIGREHADAGATARRGPTRENEHEPELSSRFSGNSSSTGASCPFSSTSASAPKPEPPPPSSTPQHFYVGKPGDTTVLSGCTTATSSSSSTSPHHDPPTANPGQPSPPNSKDYMKKPSEDPRTSSLCFLQQLASPSDLTLQFAYSAKANIRDRETWLSLTDQVLAVGLQHFKAAELNVLLTSLAQVRGALLAGVEGRDGVSETSFHSSGSLVRPQIAVMEPKVHRFLFLVAHALRFLVEAKRYDLPSLACCWNAFRLLDYKPSVEVFFPTFNITARQLRSHPGKSRDLAYMLRYCSYFKVHLLEEQKVSERVRRRPRVHGNRGASSANRTHLRADIGPDQRRDPPSGAAVNKTRKAPARLSLTKLLLDFCVKKMGSMRVSELQHLCHSACELGGSFQANTARLWDVIGLHFLRNAGNMDWPSFFQFSVTADRLQRRGGGPPGGVAVAHLPLAGGRGPEEDLGIQPPLHLKPNAFPLGGEAYFRVLEAKVLGERDKLQPTEVCGTLQLLQRYFVTSNALLVSTLADAFYAHWKITLNDGDDKGAPRSGARAQMKSTHSSSYSPAQRLVVLRTLLALGTGAASNGNGNATSNGLWHSLLKPAYRKQFLNYFPHAGFSSENRKGPPDAFEHSPLLQAQLLIVLMRCLHKFVPKYAEESIKCCAAELEALLATRILAPSGKHPEKKLTEEPSPAALGDLRSTRGRPTSSWHPDHPDGAAYDRQMTSPVLAARPAAALVRRQSEAPGAAAKPSPPVRPPGHTTASPRFNAEVLRGLDEISAAVKISAASSPAATKSNSKSNDSTSSVGSGPKTSPTDPLPPRASVQRFSTDKNRVAYHSKSGIITTVDDRSSEGPGVTQCSTSSSAAADREGEQGVSGGEAILAEGDTRTDRRVMETEVPYRSIRHGHRRRPDQHPALRRLRLRRARLHHLASKTQKSLRQKEAEKRRRKQQARVELLKRRETAVDYRERVIVATRDLAWRAVPTARWRLRRRVVLAQLLEQEEGDEGAGKRTELESRSDGNNPRTSRSREERENFALARDVVALLRDDTVLDGEDFAGLRSLLEKSFRKNPPASGDP